jgi:murein DD-endopeptidase MepM/ murein hydrolase activator NlpD
MQGMRLRVAETAKERLAQTVALASLLIGSAALASPVVTHANLVSRTSTAMERASLTLRPALPAPEVLVWQGADLDGDGAADFANPTGKGVRGHDAYGDGEFGASRDGGVRRHEGVDFMASAGQPVDAPISGYVTKIGYAYADDGNLKFVEITNPALHYAARVFYVDPEVQVGQTVALGSEIGRHHSLAQKYPGGMTDHVHLEILDKRGRRIDGGGVITAKLEPADRLAAD